MGGWALAWVPEGGATAEPRSQPQRHPCLLGQAMSHWRPPSVSSGHPLQPDALPLTHATRDKHSPLRNVRLPAPQLPLPPPHPSSSANANSWREPQVAVAPCRGHPAPVKVCIPQHPNVVWCRRRTCPRLPPPLLPPPQPRVPSRSRRDADGLTARWWPPDVAWGVAIALPRGPTSAEDSRPPKEVVASEVTSLSLGFGVLPRPLPQARAFGVGSTHAPPPRAVGSRRLARCGGHEATETGLAYAPVSQAHCHNHIVQCFACCTAAGGGGGSGFDPPLEHEEPHDPRLRSVLWPKGLVPPPPTPRPGSARTPCGWRRGVQNKIRPPLPLPPPVFLKQTAPPPKPG